MSRAQRGDDEGIATSGVLITVFVAVLAVVFVALLPLLRGTEQAARTQTSADAAALAGAEDVRQGVLDDLAEVTLWTVVGSHPTYGEWTPGAGLPVMIGYGAAHEYARDNGAQVAPSDYHYEPLDGTVWVRSRLQEQAPGGGRAMSEATASTGLQVSDCRLTASRSELPPPSPSPSPTPTPTASPSPTPSPTPTPTEPPAPIYTEWEFVFSCPGEGSVSGSSLSTVLAGARGIVDDAMEPRLVD